MLGRIAIAVVIGVVVFLACVLLGALLVSISVGFAVTVGNFLKQYAGLIGLLAALYNFFAGTPSLRI